MSETEKLIIEISKEDIELIRKTSFVEDETTMFKQNPSDRQGTMMLFRVMDSVKNGTPLEEVRTEIEALQSERYYFGFDTCKEGVLEIIDKHINKESGNNEF